jgi:hypothetical protein
MQAKINRGIDSNLYLPLFWTEKVFVNCFLASAIYRALKEAEINLRILALNDYVYQTASKIIVTL